MISRIVTKERRGRGLITALALGGLAAAVLLWAGIALAVHQDGLFELDTNSSAAICAPLTAPCGDANVADDPAGGADDWANVYAQVEDPTLTPATGGDHAFARTFFSDPTSSAENSFFTGGGSKDTNAISQWQYATTNDVVPDKDDIAHLFAAAYHPTTGPDLGHSIIYFGMDRYDNNGDSETGFWFFKSPVSLNGSGGFTGVHTAATATSGGDLLVLADWGGSNPVGAITVYEWVGGKNPLRLVADSSTTPADCADAAPNDNYCAVVNRQNVSQPWSFLDKGGSQVIRPLELFEAGLDLNDLLGADACFSSFLGATRSSHSTTAQLKDFALGQFEQCGAAISIASSATNQVGTAHTFTVHVTKSIGGVPTGASGVKPVVTFTPNSAVSSKTDNCASTGTNASGDCTVVINSTTTGTITAHAAATVTIGTDSFSVETDGVSPNSGDATKTYVDARISIATAGTNAVGTAHTFTVTVEKDSGSGFGPASGVTVTPSISGTGSITGGTCVGSGATKTDANGQCTIIVNSSSTGTGTVNASATVRVNGTVGYADVAVATDGAGAYAGHISNTKTWVDAKISIAASGTNQVGTAHTFTVTVMKDSGSGFVAASGVTVSPSETGVGTITGGTCVASGATKTDANGQCTIIVNSSSTGTSTVGASAAVVVAGTVGSATVNVSTNGSGNNSAAATKTWVDARISIGTAGTNEVGHPHTFTVTVEKTNGATWIAASGVTVTPSISGVGTITGGTCVASGATKTDANGQCTIVVSSSTTGVATVNATATVTVAGTVGSADVAVSTTGHGADSISNTKTWVDAYIEINPPEATNTVGDPHTFTVTVWKDAGDGLGWVKATDGNVDVALTDSGGAVSVLDAASSTCDDNQPSDDNLDSNGQCTTVFTSSSAGTVTGHATVTLLVGGVTLTRETDGNAPNSGDAVKHFVSGSIGWTKVDNAGNLQGGATFTVCNTATYTLPSGPMVDLAEPFDCFDVLDNGPKDLADQDDGVFLISGLSLGTYTIKEKIAPAGFTPDPDTETVKLVPGDTDQTIEQAFVNNRSIIKITGFGYTNAPVGTPLAGVLTGTTTFTVKLHNYGLAPADLTDSWLVISAGNKTQGTLTCNGTGTDGLMLELTGTAAANGDLGPFTITCTYTGLNDGARVFADLSVFYTTNGLERQASGSPARIYFTVQGD